MAQLLGEHRYQLDPKGRLTLPARFREALAEGVFLRFGPDPCVYAYSPEEWETVTKDVRALSDWVPENRALKRMLGSKSEEGSLDGQGRLVIPQPLRKLARLERDVTVVGQFDHLEIWSTEEWRRFDEENAALYASGALRPDAQ